MELGVRYFNKVDQDEFIKAFGNVVENTEKIGKCESIKRVRICSEVARDMCKRRPFASKDGYIASLNHSIGSLTLQEKVKI